MADNGSNEVPSDPHLPTSPSSRGAPFASSPRGQDDMPPFQDESEADALLVSKYYDIVSDELDVSRETPLYCASVVSFCSYPYVWMHVHASSS